MAATLAVGIATPVDIGQAVAVGVAVDIGAEVGMEVASRVKVSAVVGIDGGNSLTAVTVGDTMADGC